MLDRDQMEAPQFSDQSHSKPKNPKPRTTFNPMSAFLAPLQFGLALSQATYTNAQQSSTLRQLERERAEKRKA